MSAIPTTQHIAIGDLLSTKKSMFQVQSFLGEGTFGKVAKCSRIGDNKTAAIKMMINEGTNIQMAKEEATILAQLRSLDSDSSNLVRWYQHFICKGHICLMFEHLDKNLFDFMKERNYQPLLLKEIRPIVQQLANALHHLKTAGIIHADLKLENVMLVDHAREPFRVKVIDFGLACKVSAAKQGAHLQTRPYRSPEIILGLPFTEAIDMWSLGCLAASLYIGYFLYPGMNEYDMMRYIVETQGQPPDNMLDLAQKTGCFFKRLPESTASNNKYRLQTPEEFKARTKIQPLDTRRVRLNSLQDLLRVRAINSSNSTDKAAEKADRLMFVDMLIRMLQIDAAKRITPLQVLGHWFISMRHLVSRQSNSSHVKSCFETMEACKKKTPNPGNQSFHCGPQQQPSSGTNQNVQQNLPHPSAERCGQTKRHTIIPNPCTSTQTTSSVKPGMKRKAVDTDETLHLSKRVKSEWQRESCAGPSTTSNCLNLAKYHQATTAAPKPSNSSQTQSDTRPALKRKADSKDKGHRRMDSDCYTASEDDRKRFRRSHPLTSSSNSQTQSCISPRVKRKMAQDEDANNLPGQDGKRARKSPTGPVT